MTLRRYNIVPKFVGTESNHVYEPAEDGEIVFADNAVTEVAALQNELARAWVKIRSLERDAEFCAAAHK